MNDEAREKFRARYRAAISPNYSGFLHLSVVLFGAGGLISFGISQLENVTLLQILFVVALYVVYNWAEWYTHCFWGHKKTDLFKFFYQRHTGDHHTFFVEHDMEYQMVLDWRVVIFPIALLVATAVVFALPAGLVSYFVLGWNYGWLAFVTIMCCYLAYEVLHFSYHLQKGSVTERIFKLIPGWTYLRLFHTVHHNRHLMAEGNFNITLPLFDWLCGTLYFSSDEWAKAKGRGNTTPAE
ncbi:hypothetical protein [Shimia sp. R9_3]|uniref:hypothetical protein n=1 Tax=Shimia sp. R9_3 TaxID=2821113 RepID=UPI001ADC0F1F|nr:hypothetical protein [Shimia sp. R9_3]MBO9403061.1 hypothetical protein [Shimia sp. R9_3]